LAVRRKKNKKYKNLVSVNRFAICGKFTRALLAHHIFTFYVKVFGESAQLKSPLKFSGEILPIWANFPQIRNFLAGHWDEIRPNQKKFAHKFWGKT
jgi:hypothetical protein